MTDKTLPGRLAARLQADPAAPLVTFYDDESGDRTELSAATFANWVAKTANLLVDGLGLAPGDRALVELPLHWQSLVVVAGCWAAGLVVGFDGSAEVTVVAEGSARTADELVALSLRPLGAGLASPTGAATDYAAEVRSYGDRFVGAGPGPADPALPGRSHTELVAAATGAPRRVLLAPTGDPLLDERLLVAAYLEPLCSGGSVVLCRHADPTLLAHRAETERAGL